MHIGFLQPRVGNLDKFDFLFELLELMDDYFKIEGSGVAHTTSDSICQIL